MRKLLTLLYEFKILDFQVDLDWRKGIKETKLFCMNLKPGLEKNNVGLEVAGGPCPPGKQMLNVF